jgi:alpha-L-fucosidase
MKTVKEYVAEDTSAARLQATKKGVDAFISARFGLSVHWGLYALIGRGEWVLHTEGIPHETYKSLASRFNPTRFDAREWADLCLESGQKFLLLTSKHHDGFSMFDTKLSDFKVTNTPLKRDVIGELAEALRERGLGLHFYYSLLDWTRPAYRKDWPAYVAYYQGQLRELLTNYGPIGGIIFDGYWPRQEFEESDAYFAPGGKWDLAGTYDLIHTLQPDCVVSNNTHILPLKGEDYQVWELDMPGENKIGFNTTEVGDRARAVWWNVNRGWSYCPSTHEVKPASQLVSSLVEANRRQATFFLNVGPRPFGDIHPDEERILREMGTMVRAQAKQE